MKTNIYINLFLCSCIWTLRAEFIYWAFYEISFRKYYETFVIYLSKNLFKKYILTIYFQICSKFIFKYFQICFIGIVRKYILSKYCKSDISQEKKEEEICNKKPIQKKMFVHMRAPEFFEVYTSAHTKIEALVESW